MSAYARACGLVALLLAVSLASAEPVTFTGTVLGPDEKPVAGATVYTRDMPPQGELRQVEATTDAAGKFTVTVQTPRPDYPTGFVAVKEGFALGVANAKAGEPLVLRLGDKPTSRSVKVTTPEGQPLGGATVRLQSLILGDGPERRGHFLGGIDRLSGQTDAAGRYVIGALPKGAQVYVQVTAEGRASAYQQSSQGSEGELAIALTPEAVITGRVVRDGQPVKDVRIFCQTQNEARQGPYGGGYGAATTGEDGTYRVKGLSASIYNVILDPPEGVTAVAVEGVKVEAGQTVEGKDFALVPGGLVRGKVTEQGTGKLLAGLNIAAYGPARPQSSAACQVTKTDARGCYELRLPAGKNRVYFQGGEGYSYSNTPDTNREIEVKDGQVTDGVDFVLKPPLRARGVVLGLDGQPAAGVRVRVSLRWDSPFETGLISPDGKFDLPVAAQEPGFVPEVIATDTAHGLIGATPVAAPTDQLVVRLQPAAYLLGTALDPDDKPLAGISFMVMRPIGEHDYRSLVETRTDAEGHVKLGPLPPGVPLRLANTSDWYDYGVGEQWWQKEQNLTLQPGEQRELPVVRLNPVGRSLTVWVGDGQQHPTPEALVFARGLKEPVRSDAVGFAKLTGLPLKGKLTVVALHPTETLVGAIEANPEWPDVPAVVLRPLAAVTGQVVDKASQPVASKTVFTYGEGLQQLMYQGGEVLRQRLNFGYQGGPQAPTDAQGRFRLEGLVPGMNYYLGVRDDPQQGARLFQQFTPTGEPDQDLGTLKWEGEPPR